MSSHKTRDRVASTKRIVLWWDTLQFRTYRHIFQPVQNRIKVHFLQQERFQKSRHSPQALRGWGTEGAGLAARRRVGRVTFVDHVGSWALLLPVSSRLKISHSFCIKDIMFYYENSKHQYPEIVVDLFVLHANSYLKLQPFFPSFTNKINSLINYK